ncbi:MAG: hypothetical protein Q4B99_02240 [Clostridia bacterium]|nr:hypothetical protein [Clostridia bacterium]
MKLVRNAPRKLAAMILAMLFALLAFGCAPAEPRVLEACEQYAEFGAVELEKVCLIKIGTGAGELGDPIALMSAAQAEASEHGSEWVPPGSRPVVVYVSADDSVCIVRQEPYVSPYNSVETGTVYYNIYVDGVFTRSLQHEAGDDEELSAIMAELKAEYPIEEFELKNYANEVYVQLEDGTYALQARFSYMNDERLWVMRDYLTLLAIYNAEETYAELSLPVPEDILQRLMSYDAMPATVFVDSEDNLYLQSWYSGSVFEQVGYSGDNGDDASGVIVFKYGLDGELKSYACFACDYESDTQQSYMPQYFTGRGCVYTTMVDSDGVWVVKAPL